MTEEATGETGETTETEKPWCGYVRVSTAMQEARGVSLDAQEQIIREGLARDKHEVRRIYKDVATGTTHDRQGLQEMLEDCREGRWGGIGFYDLSRFSRDNIDMLTIFRELNELGVKWIAFSDHMDHTTSEVLLALMGGLNQDAAKEGRRRTKDALHYKCKNGLYAGGRAPYGYRLAEKGRLVEDSETAPILRRIMASVAEGEPYRRIALALNREGAPTPRGGRWHSGTIEKMVLNDKYLGIQRYGTAEGSWPFPLLVDVELVQAARAEAKARRLQTGPRGKRSPWLRLLYCGVCGQRMHLNACGRAGEGRVTGFLCKGYLGGYESGRTRMHETVFLSIGRLRDVTEAVLQTAAACERSVIVEEEAPDPPDFQKRLAKLAVRAGRIKQMYWRDADMTLAEYEVEHALIEREKNELLALRDGQRPVESREVGNLMESFSELTVEEQHKGLRMFVDRVLIRSRTEVQVYLRYRPGWPMMIRITYETERVIELIETRVSSVSPFDY